MKLRKLKTIASQTLKEHGLFQQGWRFELDNAKKRFGICQHYNKIISMSRILSSLNDEDKVLDTLLHEIAHALLPAHQGHGPAWKAQAVTVGCLPNRCYDDKTTITPDAPFEAVCPKCKRVHKRSRSVNPSRSIACYHCCNKYNGGRFSREYILNFERVR